MLPDGVSLGRLQGRLRTLQPSAHGSRGQCASEGPGDWLYPGGKALCGRVRGHRWEPVLIGDKAYRYLLGLPSLDYELIAYTSEETEAAREVSERVGCLMDGSGVEAVGSVTAESLTHIARQPGVVAVSVFHEGFALQALGSADFEQVAAVAEDLLRAGTRITGDMDMGDLSQMILETQAGKLIIAPYRDLFVCVLANPDANLGLIRLSIRVYRIGALSGCRQTITAGWRGQVLTDRTRSRRAGWESGAPLLPTRPCPR